MRPIVEEMDKLSAERQDQDILNNTTAKAMRARAELIKKEADEKVAAAGNKALVEVLKRIVARVEEGATSYSLNSMSTPVLTYVVAGLEKRGFNVVGGVVSWEPLSLDEVFTSRSSDDRLNRPGLARPIPQTSNTIDTQGGARYD